MAHSHCPRTRPTPRQIARPIKMAYIEFCEGVHTVTRQYHYCYWLRHLKDLIIGLGVGQCESTITALRENISLWEGVLVLKGN